MKLKGREIPILTQNRCQVKNSKQAQRHIMKKGQFNKRIEVYYTKIHENYSLSPVAQACHPCDTGDRDKADLSSNPGQANSS
jgi:hypothetical protein